MRLVSEDILHFEDKLYLFANNMNMLYSIEIETGCIELIGGIPNRNFYDKRLVAAIIEWKRCIYLIPLVSGNIWIYSIDNKNWEEIEINSYENNWANSYFRNAVIFNDILYLFGGYYPAIVKVELTTKNVQYDFDVFAKRKKEEKDLFFRGTPVQVDDNVYLASAIDNSILKYSLTKSTYEWISVGKDGDKFSGIEWDGNNFWIAPRHNGMDIIKLTGTKEVRYSLPSELSLNNSVYIGICGINGMYVIPSRYGDTGAIQFNTDGTFKVTDKYYSVYKKKCDEILIQDMNGNISFIDKKGTVKEYSGEMSADKVLEMINGFSEFRNINLNEVMRENLLLSLRDWLLFMRIKEK